MKSTRKPFFGKFLLLFVLSASGIIFGTTTITAEEGGVFQSDYRFHVEYKSGETEIDMDEVLSLTINNNKGEFPGNGSIEYYIPVNITDEEILSTLELYLPGVFVEYVADHSVGEKLQMFFTGRIESPTAIPCEENAYYTLFWIYEEPNQTYRELNRISFGNISQTSSMVIIDDNALLSSGDWIAEGLHYSFNPLVIETYVVSFRVSGIDLEVDIKGYYEKATGLLVYSSAFYQDRGVEFSSQISLISTDFPLETFDNQAYPLALGLSIGLGGLTIVLIVWRIKMKKQPKVPSRIDNL